VQLQILGKKRQGDTAQRKENKNNYVLHGFSVQWLKVKKIVSETRSERVKTENCQKAVLLQKEA